MTVMQKNSLTSDPIPDFSCAAIVVAAGLGRRAAVHNSPKSKTTSVENVPLLAKQFWQLGPKMVLLHSVDYFCAHPQIKEVILVLPDSEISTMSELILAADTPVHLVSGGVTRLDSVRAGLDVLDSMPECDKIDYVAIHDAARPLIPLGLMDRLIKALTSSNSSKIIGAAPVLPLSDSIKIIDHNILDDEKPIIGGIDRNRLAAAQTPQLFYREMISTLHKKFATRPDFTDDCSLAEEAGFQVLAIDGDKKLLKLTDADDFAVLEHWVGRAAREGPALKTAELNDMNEIRHGTGFDVHRFDQDAGPIWLAGIKIDNSRRMLAHSDGDVGLHALCDAIFGALAEGDIGSHFPPTDPQWENTNSATFLAFAVRRVAERGGKIIHLDLTFICEDPKIGPHRYAMRKRISEICGIAVARVSVKATTSEGLGFTGRGEGIAAQASASIALPTPPDKSSDELSGLASKLSQTNP